MAVSRFMAVCHSSLSGFCKRMHCFHDKPFEILQLICHTSNILLMIYILRIVSKRIKYREL